MFYHLGFAGLGALSATAAQEGRSFTGTRLGELITVERFSLWDGVLDPAGLPMPFDAEGVPKQRVDLIRAGCAVGVCYDLVTGARAGRPWTGHAFPAPLAAHGHNLGPVEHSLVIPAWRESRQALIAGLRRGLLICDHFGFISDLESRGMLSGMTRHGAFLVEDGEIVGAVKNLQWTANVPEAFKTLEACSQERSLQFIDLLWVGPATILALSVRLGRLRITDVQPRE
jgi:predicted Zn-dependent protease